MLTDEETWEQIRVAYCETTESLVEISARFKLSLRKLYLRADQFEWPKRGRGSSSNLMKAREVLRAVSPDDRAKAKLKPQPRSAQPQRRSAQSAQPRPRSVQSAQLVIALPPAVLARKALTLKLYRVLDLKLKQLEKKMEEPNNADTTSTDHERETRAIVNIQRTFERTNEKDLAHHPAHPSAPPAHTAGTGSTATSPAPSSADAASAELLRRDIAERLGRILERRNTSGNPV